MAGSGSGRGHQGMRYSGCGKLCQTMGVQASQDCIDQSWMCRRMLSDKIQQIQGLAWAYHLLIVALPDQEWVAKASV
jgi:hypothetical protein